MSADDTTGTGSRRIDKVLAEDYLDGLRGASLEDVRAMRAEAEQEEVDLSYLRRMVQGRLDVLRAEVAHREGGREGVGLVAGLAKILAEEPRSPARGLGRHSALEPSRVDQHRRYVEALVADVDLSDVSRSDADLAAAQEVLGQEEQVLSTKRREVQAVMDACSAELTRRYRDGEADVDALLGVAADEG